MPRPNNKDFYEMFIKEFIKRIYQKILIKNFIDRVLIKNRFAKLTTNC